MKKTIGLVVVLLISLIMLTGCVNINYEVTVNKDGSGDITYIYAFSKSALESLQVSAEDMVANMKEQAEDNSYITEVYEDDDYAGFKATKHIDNLEKDFSLQEAFGEEYVTEDKDEADNGIKIKNSLFKTEISQNAKIDLTSMKDLSSMVKMKYTVNLPCNVNKSNASEQNGSALTWELNGGEVNNIEFTASGLNIWPIIVIIVLIVALLAIGFLVLEKNKKNNDNVKVKEENK